MAETTTASQNAKAGKITPNALKPLIISAVNYLKKYKEFIKEIENPNFILKETSEGLRKGFKIIDEIKRDSQVGSDLRTRKGKIKSLQWSIQVDSDVESDIEQGKELKRLIEPIYRDLVTEIQEALEYGYAIVEKNWTIENGQVILQSVKGHDPGNWVFDENCTPGLKTVEKPEPTAVPMERIIHATFDAPRGNPYGRSILIEAFWPWYWKKHAILFWSIFCEKFGQPTVIGWHAKGAETEEIASLLDTLESIQSDTAVTLEEGWRIELLEAKRTGTDSYEAFVKYCDRAISKAILSTVLTTNESQYGTRAATSEQKDVTDEVLEGDSIRIQDIITRDVVHLLALWNFNFTVPPQLYIHYDAKSIPKEEAEGDEIQQRIMPITLDDLYKKYGWTKPEGDTPVIFNGVITTWDAIMIGQAQGNQSQPAFSKFSAEEPDKTNGTDEELSLGLKEKDEAVFLLKEGDYLDRVFTENKPRIDAAVEMKTIEKAFEVEGYSQALPGLENASLTDTRHIWEEFLELAGCLAEFSVQHQVSRIPQGMYSQFDKTDPLAGVSLVDMDYGIEAFKVIKPTEAIKWFKKKVPLKKEVWEQLKKQLKNHAFYLAKIDDMEVLLRIKEEMLKSLEEGLTYYDFKKSLREILDVKKLNTYLRTSFNTNMFSALSVENERALLRNTDMYPYWRYSALLDVHTCDLCAALHNFVARYDHPAWSIITPPNHHKCKCRKVIATPAEVQQYLGRIVWNPENPALRPQPGFDINPATNMERVFQKIILEKQAQSLLLNTQIRQLEVA
jgi:SPP1 gp7 family putative phage head morphogenesis protein